MLDAPNLGRRNLLINGAMLLAQRGTSTSFAHDGTTSTYALDRWRFSLGGTHEQLDGTVAQVADNPLGGTGKSLKWTTGTPESSYDADEYAYFTQKVEAQNLNHIQNGNSNAKKLTLSFYVKSSITGTYAVGLYKPDNTGRIFNKTYTISSANTWEKKSITFVGDTAGGGINNDNSEGLWISWHLGSGSNYSGGGSTSGWVNYSNDKWADGQGTNAVMTTASATWQMTECQLEVGDTATDFEHRSFGEELALCQRYYQITTSGGNAYSNLCLLGCYGTGTDQRGVIPFTTEMRAGPAISSSGNLQVLTGVGASYSSLSAGDGLGTHHAGIRVNTSGNMSTGQVSIFRLNNDATAHLQFDAEL